MGGGGSWCGDFGTNICTVCFSNHHSGCGVSGGSYQTDTHAKKIANELAVMKKEIAQDAATKENAILDYLTQDISAFLREVSKFNQVDFSGKKLNIDLDYIKKQNDNVVDEVRGSISDYVNKKIVQTNKDVSVILQENDDKKRQQNFSHFTKNVLLEAIKLFREKIEKCVDKQCNFIEGEIESRLKEVNKDMKEAIEECKKIVELKNSSSEKIERVKIGYMYQIGLCDLLLKEVGGMVE